MSTIFSELFSTEFLFLPFSSSRPNERKVESCIHEKMRNQTFDDLTGVNRTPTRRNIVASSVFLDGVRNRTRLKNKKGMSFLIEHHGFCRILYKLILLFQKFTKHPWILEHERIYRIFEVGVRFSVELSRCRTQKIPRIFLSRKTKTRFDLYPKYPEHWQTRVTVNSFFVQRIFPSSKFLRREFSRYHWQRIIRAIGI